MILKHSRQFRFVYQQTFPIFCSQLNTMLLLKYYNNLKAFRENSIFLKNMKIRSYTSYQLTLITFGHER